MGINPNSGDGVEKNYTIDGRQNAENLVTEAEHTGQEAGKAFAHIAAQADSANKSTAELASRVKALEESQKASAPRTVWWTGLGQAPRISPGETVVNMSTGEVWAG